jgi:hypothetical protein
MEVEKIRPGTVAEGAGLLSRVDDFGEQHGRQESIGHELGSCPNEELLDLGQRRLGVPYPGPMITAGEFDELRPRDPIRDVPTRTHVDDMVVFSVEDEGWHVDRW